MTRLAMISAVNPYPADSGKKVVLAGLIEYFSTRIGAENVHYLLIGRNPSGDFPVPLRPITAPKARQALAALAVRTVTGRSSMQESFLWSRTTASAIERCLQELEPEIELYDTVRAGQYAAYTPGPMRICYLDDLFSQRYASMLSAGSTDKSVEFKPLGNFAEHVPKALHPLTDHRGLQKTLLSAERKLIARSEDNAARRFAHSLLVNHHETSFLQQRSNSDEGRVVTIPPLINAPTTTTRDYRGKPQFLFLGLLSMPHNDDGLRSFIRDTWPAVLARIPNAWLRVVGREPLPELHAAISKYGSGAISLEGYVPDLGALMAESAAMLNPLRLGSGIKLKIIESLGRGLPVVSTTVGASGIRSGTDTGVCLADGPAEWVDQLEQLTSPTHNSEVSWAATTHFEAAYSRPAVFAAYDRVFGLGG